MLKSTQPVIGRVERQAPPPVVLTPGEAAVPAVSLTAIGPRASATAQPAMGDPLDAMRRPTGAGTVNSGGVGELHRELGSESVCEPVQYSDGRGRAA